ncbi:Hypothetical Protein FCC1311_006772 [Hondaea fermentalgiana]|uniref:Uncharacterized protein n=1 Tax=Hondaea fermentalgiana TaxID=2315210 RepID=A0A2R5G2B0_9STRA|nr:Hypothetical Protein FCC1311_006772 [Hondaea fermentalgiana]|eukprot:GBG24459.1 Hypothetical Protein FCC1311_006772 [Hondaea fermentalgiana]
MRVPPKRPKSKSVPSEDWPGSAVATSVAQSMKDIPMAEEASREVRRAKRAGSQPLMVETRQRRHGSVSSSGSAWSMVSAEELSASARRSVARWLSQESAFRVRGLSDDVFIADLRDSMVLCSILEKLGWLLDADAAARVQAHDPFGTNGGDSRRGMSRAIRRENLAAFNTSIAEVTDMDHGYVATIEDLRAENLDAIILPFLIEFKDIVDEANGVTLGELTVSTPLSSSSAAAATAMAWEESSPAVSAAVHAASLRNDGANDDVTGAARKAAGAGELDPVTEEMELPRPSRTRRRRRPRTRARSHKGQLLSVDEEEVDEALSSFIGLVIFVCVMFFILTFLTDIIGLTDIGFASLLGLRRSQPPREDISWYADIKRSW